MAQALIVIDIQEGLVNENPYDSKNLIANTKAIIQYFRDQNIEVIFIRHSEDEGLLATGSDNWQNRFAQLNTTKEILSIN